MNGTTISSPATSSALSASPVDRHGGDYRGGVIRGIAVATIGEAAGHDLWVDEVFLQQVAVAINYRPRGVKSRFMHPRNGLGDGLGQFLGRVKSAVVEGDVVRADEHFARSAHGTPYGNLAGYLMDRTEEDSQSFGTSVLFLRDFAAERDFIIAHGGRIIEGPDGKEIVNFASPDPRNQKNLPHARVKLVQAVDVVDTPAANPNGLFSVGDEWKCSAIECNRGLRVPQCFDNPGEAIMPDEKKSAETAAAPAKEKKPEEQAVETPAEEKPAEQVPPVAEEKKPEEKPAEMSAGQKFLTAFGDKGGVWFAQGKTFEEAQALYASELKAENVTLSKKVEELQTQLKASRGETQPVSFQAAPEKEQSAPQPQEVKNLGSNMAKFVAGIKFARKK